MKDILGYPDRKSGGVIRLFLLLSIGLCGLTAFATSDHWATTYQVMPDPQKSGLVIRPVSFLTWYSSPEIEFSAISEPNHLDQRANSSTDNANLIYLYGIKVNAIDHSVASGTVVLVDLSGLSMPKVPFYPFAEEVVVSNTVQCVIRTARKCGCKQVDIQIKPPVTMSDIKWGKYEQVICFE